MVRMLFGLTAAAALTFAAPAKADAANWYFGVSSGYGGGFGGHYGAHYGARYGVAPSRAYAARRVYASPHAYPHYGPHVHRRAYAPRVAPYCPTRYGGYGRVRTRYGYGGNPHYRW